jgi:ATP-binding cassette subfamily A (ABC1) protein 3
MNFGIACVMMLVDSIIYGLIGKYIRSVFPGKNGQKKPFWYPFLPSTWCFCKKKFNGQNGISSGFRIERESQPNPFTARMKRKKEKEDSDNSFSFIEIDPNNEQEPSHLSVGIAFENLSKQFGQNKKAVENLSLKLYENQITALLGHNGAGKVNKNLTLSFYSFVFSIDNNH